MAISIGHVAMLKALSCPHFTMYRCVKITHCTFNFTRMRDAAGQSSGETANFDLVPKRGAKAGARG